MTGKDQKSDLLNIQPILRHLYSDELACNKTGRIAGQGAVMVTTVSSSGRSIVCHTTVASQGIEKLSAPGLPRPTGKTQKLSTEEGWVSGWRWVEVAHCVQHDSAQ